jgi:hypothetical protein
MKPNRPTLKDLGVTPAILAALRDADLVIFPIQPTAAMLKEAWAAAHAENAGEVSSEMIAAWETCKRS